MKSLLRIGEVAQLLGVTTKAIRHYHKVGLLPEPGRSKSGYRLYTARDLLTLRRIRRLQALGLSLRQIAILLRDELHNRPLRKVLETLLAEVSDQLEVLQERREHIQHLLAEETLDDPDTPFDVPPTLRQALAQLHGQLPDFSPAALRQETKLFAQLDEFHWPGGEQLRERAMAFARYAADHPDEYHQLAAWSNRLAALADLPEDSPEIDRLADEFAGSVAARFLLHAPGVDALSEDKPFAGILKEMVGIALAPSVRRFVQRVASDSDFHDKAE